MGSQRPVNSVLKPKVGGDTCVRNFYNAEILTESTKSNSDRITGKMKAKLTNRNS